MRALPSVFRVLVVLAAGLPCFAAHGAGEDLAQVGVVKKVENEASIAVASAARPARVGTPVHLKDELRTGADGRILVAGQAWNAYGGVSQYACTLLRVQADGAADA